MIDKVKKVKSYRLYKNIELEIIKEISVNSNYYSNLNFQKIKNIIVEILKPYNIEYKIDYQYSLTHDEISILLENDFVIKITKHSESYSI